MILITGSRGFLGRHLVPEMNGHSILSPSSRQLDLLDANSVKRYFSSHNITGVIHLAANCGGIGKNKDQPATMGIDNMLMGVNLVNECIHHRKKIKKILLVGSVCGYPGEAQVPFKEEYIGCGQPEETNRLYGLGKNWMTELGKSCVKEFGMNFVSLYPVNMLGEYDNFGKGAHVVPDLINKIYRAKRKGAKRVELWGTGMASREFCYAGDTARAIRLAFDLHNDPDPVNIGTGKSITIFDLAHTIKTKMDYRGEIVFDAKNPDGQMKRQLDIEKAKAFGFEAQISLSTALDRTLDYYYSEHLILEKFKRLLFWLRVS